MCPTVVFGLIDQLIADVDFRNIVHQKKFRHSKDIEGRSGVFTQQLRKQAYLPTVLGYIFVPIESDWLGLAQDAFELIQFHDEADDFPQIAAQKCSLNVEDASHGFLKVPNPRH